MYSAGTTFSSISITSAPSDEYRQQAIDTFLPINFQLCIRRDGEFLDKDGEGVPANGNPNDKDSKVP